MNLSTINLLENFKNELHLTGYYKYDARLRQPVANPQRRGEKIIVGQTCRNTRLVHGCYCASMFHEYNAIFDVPWMYLQRGLR